MWANKIPSCNNKISIIQLDHARHQMRRDSLFNKKNYIYLFLFVANRRQVKSKRVSIH
jgi:hypothetical protein